MTLLLITRTGIIEQIFSLVCKKLNIELTIFDNNNFSEQYDLIIVDQNLIDDKFNTIKQFSRRLGAISSEELPFDKSRDFIIPRPFLPTKLQDIIKEQILIIEEDIFIEKEISSISNYESDKYEEDDSVTIPIITDYVEALGEDVSLDVEQNNDESIVSFSSMHSSGILDSSELLKINDILDEDMHNEVVMEENDWKDISDLIDEALNEVKEYEFNLSKPESSKDDNNLIKLVLSDYDMNELKPFLENFDQKIIDDLSNGKNVDIRLILNDNN